MRLYIHVHDAVTLALSAREKVVSILQTGDRAVDDPWTYGLFAKEIIPYKRVYQLYHIPTFSFTSITDIYTKLTLDENIYLNTLNVHKNNIR